MHPTATEPDPPVADAPAPVGDDPRHALRRRRAQVTAAVALVGILVSLIGLGLLVRPLATPVQDCGTAASFLLRGGTDVLVDDEHPPRGVTRAEARANNASPCQERAANRARPAATLVVLGVLVALLALMVELVMRVRWHRADTRIRR